MTLEDQIRRIVREELQRASADHVDYLTTRDAAAVAKVAEGTIRRWIRSGRLPTHRAGRVMRVRRTDLVELLKRSESPGMSPEAMAARDFG